MFDPYGRDVLSDNPHHRDPRSARRPSRPVAATTGLVVEDPTSGFVGVVTQVEKTPAGYVVELEDRRGRRRTFPLGGGWWVDGQPVELVLPTGTTGDRARTKPKGPARTASGSRAVNLTRARVARQSRIYVEGAHDAELVEKIWGDDLRVEGIVVEYLEGIDHLLEVLEVVSPTPAARIGVLVDHAVSNSKESRIAAEAMRRYPQAVLVVGHPYLDIWQAVKPTVMGLSTWPPYPRGSDPKVITLQALGLPHADAHDIGLGWQAILNRVRTYRDLEPALLGRVEELIDFVTAEGSL